MLAVGVTDGESLFFVTEAAYMIDHDQSGTLQTFTKETDRNIEMSADKDFLTNCTDKFPKFLE